MKSISAHNPVMALVAPFIGYVTPFVVPEVPSMAAFEKEAEKNRSILEWSEGLQKR